MDKDYLWHLPIQDLNPTTFVDFPGHIAATLFLSGCPFKCTYCHNPELSFNAPLKGSHIDYSVVHDFIKTHVNWTEAIVITGGEPTMSPNLIYLLNYIKSYGYKVVLHTNGYYPKNLSKIVTGGVVDYIAMDFKAPFYKYDEITKVKGSYIKVKESTDIVLNSKIDYEFRTTYHNNILSKEDLISIIETLHTLKAEAYYIQTFQKKGVLEKSLFQHTTEIPEPAIELCKKYFKKFGMR